MENFIHINDKAHYFSPYLVTPLYTDAPLENPLLFLLEGNKKDKSFQLDVRGVREFTKITWKKFNGTFLNWRQILAWSCASSLQVPSHKCLTEHL